ncbi:hypothetical protein PENTCL1PPCAC_22188, partial [Pristionchus entomophagus]
GARLSLPLLTTTLIILSFLVANVQACIPMTPNSPGIPAEVACTKCSDTLLTFGMVGNGRWDKSEDSNGACAVGIFTCNGNTAEIHYFANADFTQMLGFANNPAVLKLDCNGAGTQWQKAGTTVKSARCMAT